ncbi:MAG: cytochrome C biogenesis protein ResC [Actinobacteria bacterium QS_8_72_14]|nr:MAG: cytochrome C biogenesis protein ResC [Actinobacteria bacterium QS_8_72_14]
MSPFELITDANFVVAAAVAIAAGVVSFASPCVLPLVPGYLSYMTGLSAAELGQGSAGRMRVLAGASLFVLGFAVPITLLGFVGGQIGTLLHSTGWRAALGLLVVAFGVMLSGVVPWQWLGGERRVSGQAVDGGVLGALPLGFVFGVGWVPCVGPALAAILTLTAATGGAAIRGGALAFVYALGLGVPFVLLGLAFHRAGGALALLRRHAVLVQRLGGVLLIAVGLAIATGLWSQLIRLLQPIIGGWTLPL